MDVNELIEKLLTDHLPSFVGADDQASRSGLSTEMTNIIADVRKSHEEVMASLNAAEETIASLSASNDSLKEANEKYFRAHVAEVLEDVQDKTEQDPEPIVEELVDDGYSIDDLTETANPVKEDEIIEDVESDYDDEDII